MAKIDIQEYVDININEIVKLYESVGWSNYINNTVMLEAAYSHSLKILSAWDEDKLVGIIRGVGDGYSILYIQDIIVLPDYQGQGIGTMLFDSIDKLYPLVYQKVLITDNQPSTVHFYKKFGFVKTEDYRCVAFVKYTV